MKKHEYNKARLCAKYACFDDSWDWKYSRLLCEMAGNEREFDTISQVIKMPYEGAIYRAAIKLGVQEYLP